MAAKGFRKSIELLGSIPQLIVGSNDIVLNPNSKVSVTGFSYYWANIVIWGQILTY